MTNDPQPGQIWADDTGEFTLRGTVLLVTGECGPGAFGASMFDTAEDCRLPASLDILLFPEDFSRLRLVSTISTEGRT